MEIHAPRFDSFEQKLDAILLIAQENLSQPRLADEKFRNVCVAICRSDDYENAPVFKQYISLLKDEGMISQLQGKYDNDIRFYYYAATIKGLTFEGYELKKINDAKERDYRMGFDNKIADMTALGASSTSSLSDRTEKVAMMTENLAKWTRYLFRATISLVAVEVLKDLHFFEWVYSLFHCGK